MERGAKKVKIFTWISFYFILLFFCEVEWRRESFENCDGKWKNVEIAALDGVVKKSLTHSRNGSWTISASIHLRFSSHSNCVSASAFVCATRIYLWSVLSIREHADDFALAKCDRYEEGNSFTRKLYHQNGSKWYKHSTVNKREWKGSESDTSLEEEWAHLSEMKWMSSKASLSRNKCWKLENCAMSRWSSSNETLKTYIESVQREHFSPFWIKHFILIIFPSRFRPFHFASVLSFNFFPRTVTLTFEFIRSKIQQREDEGSGGARIRKKISTARQLSSSSFTLKLETLSDRRENLWFFPSAELCHDLSCKH